MWFLLLLPFIPVLSGLYNVKCLPGCHCGADVIKCNDIQHKNASFLRLINAVSYPNLKYVIMNGGEFFDLPDDNLFGIYSHKNLRYLNLTNCRITSIGKNTFSGVPNIHFLYLNGNPIREVHPDALSPLKNLETIDLSDVFDAERMNNYQVIKDTFTVPLHRLQNIYLRGNNLRDDIGPMLCQFPHLLTVDLSENRLRQFSTPLNCSESWTHLNLAHNDLTSIPVVHAPLTHLDIHNNPLDCSTIKDNLRILSIVERNETTLCVTPKNYKGQSLAMIIQTEKDNGRMIKIILILVFLVMIVIMIVLLLCLFKRGHNGKRKDIQYNLVQMQENATEPDFL